MPTLTIQLPGQPPVFHVLKDETITIGRMKGNTIVIEDTSISLMHAKITRKDGQFYLKDLNSTNGTVVNGQPVGEARLRDQDKVRFAEITTQFLMEDIVPTVATTAPAAPVPGGAPVASAAPASATLVATAPSAVPGQTKGPAPAPVSASNSQGKASPKPTSTASSPAAKGKTNRKLIVVAAAAALVLLPGAGFLVWKTMTPGASQTEVAQAPKKTQTAPVTTQKTAAPQASKTKAADEPSPAPQATEAANAGGSNIGDLVTALKSKDVTERRQAASALHGLGMDAKDAIPALKEALKDSDSEVQMWAALALVNTQAYDKGVIPVLVRSLKNDNAVLRQVACLSLGLIPYQEGDKTTVVPALTDIAGKDPSQDVRQAAKSALNIIGAESGGAEGIGK